MDGHPPADGHCPGGSPCTSPARCSEWTWSMYCSGGQRRAPDETFSEVCPPVCPPGLPALLLTSTPTPAPPASVGGLTSSWAFQPCFHLAARVGEAKRGISWSLTRECSSQVYRRSFLPCKRLSCLWPLSPRWLVCLTDLWAFPLALCVHSPLGTHCFCAGLTPRGASTSAGPTVPSDPWSPRASGTPFRQHQVWTSFRSQSGHAFP